ncbi:hypothetical protein Ancab_038386 [Ancistrocladus abbreviatus]
MERKFPPVGDSGKREWGCGSGSWDGNCDDGCKISGMEGEGEERRKGPGNYGLLTVVTEDKEEKRNPREGKIMTHCSGFSDGTGASQSESWGPFSLWNIACDSSLGSLTVGIQLTLFCLLQLGISCENIVRASNLMNVQRKLSNAKLPLECN